MGKIRHETPPGFREVRLKGKRITYAAGLGAKATHLRFMAQALVNTKNWGPGDPGVKVAEHLAKGHRYFLTTDLKSAFDHVTLEQLIKPLIYCGIDPVWLSPRQYFFHEMGYGGVIRGASPSSFLSEICWRFGGLDWAVFEYCEKLDFHYTRFADDLLISSPRHIGRRVIGKLREKVEANGFRLNEQKTKRVDVYTETLKVLGFSIRGQTMRANPRSFGRLHNVDTGDGAYEGLKGYIRRAQKLNRQARKQRERRRG